MKKHIYFGEQVKGFETRVLNEREARAGAGTLFLFAVISFFNAFLDRNFYLLKIFVIAFLLDFAIRVFINPKYAPSLIIGRFFVKNQTPEYVGAPQKRFAWALGLLLATTMFFIVVVFNFVGLINLIICLVCLTLLFLETSFGICVGCKLYNLISKNKAKHCPGGVCEIKRKEEIQKISFTQILVLIVFLATIILIHITKVF